ncbi:MAG: hypothetical protein KI790_05375 [Cyclobacteriaceae bacterium]|nr:hypothetical protein [Cyclobacteriaceae bacterium HetDA_MAG_MS6]
MGDLLENFVQENREGFDNKEPDRNVWLSINKKLEKEKGFSLFWKIAAAFLLVTTTYLLIDKYHQPDRPKTALMTEFEQAETFYYSLISQKQAELQGYNPGELEMDFKVDIDRLDSMYSELKSTFQGSLNDPKLVEAMIGNLQLRIEILNEQIRILEKISRKSDDQYKIEI